MELIIYKKERQNLKEVPFLKDVPNQVKIKDISDMNVFTNQLVKTMILVNNLSGIKEPMTDSVKSDIKDMFLMQFKELSFDEVTYAFRLERFGVYEERTKHYQLFDSEYVSKVLVKYKKWKTTKRRQHNLNQTKENTDLMNLTDVEKERIMLSAVERCRKEIKVDGKFTSIAHHVYDFMIETNRMRTPSNDVKKACFSMALRQQKEELSQKSTTNFLLNKQLKRAIEDLGKGDARTIKIAKTILLEDYFKTELKQINTKETEQCA